MRFIAALLVLVALPAYGQVLPTCDAAVAGTVPSNESRLAWTKAVFNDGSAISGEVYVVHSRFGTTGTMTPRCTTTALTVQMKAQPASQNFYAVSTRLAGFADSALSTWANKTNSEPKTLEPPTNITIASTRIEPSEWTCRDASGAILSTHVRQDKAQESCTNLAIASLGTPYEMRPSGYRIVAR